MFFCFCVLLFAKVHLKIYLETQLISEQAGRKEGSRCLCLIQLHAYISAQAIELFKQQAMDSMKTH